MSKFVFPLLVFVTLSSFGQTNDLDTLDRYIPSLMKYFEAPGVATAVVQDGHIIYMKGFGTRSISKQEPVNEHTLFAIGSISKSFTALSLAMLVHDRKLSWDDKVTKHIPWFELYDPYVTNTITVRDLLTHRSGLRNVSGGFLFYHSSLTREQSIRQMKHLKPVSEFRSQPAYQNIMFVVAAAVVESITGAPWEDFVRARILKPLGMSNTTLSEAERNASKNVSSPHIKDRNYRLSPVRQEKLDNWAPAAGIYSSVSDMARYMNFILNNGIAGTDTLVRRDVFDEILKPQIHYPIAPEPIHNSFTSYGFGWWLTPKNGDKIVEHSGGVDGASANLIMVHNRKFGIVVLANTLAGGWINISLSLEVIGHVLNNNDYSIASQDIKNHFSKTDSLSLASRREIEAGRKSNTRASLPFEQYAGKYRDEMYGDIVVSMNGPKLRLQFSHTPLFTAELIHWHDDTFEVVWSDPRVPDGFVTFQLDNKRKVSGFQFNQPNLLDVDFGELKIVRVD